MARSKQTKATATPATTSARRTHASTPTNEDPPVQDSRTLRTSVPARITRNSQATQQSVDDDDQEEESADDEVLDTQARIRAFACGMPTVADTENAIRDARKTIQDGLNRLLGQEMARYEVKILKQRRRELKAALPTSSAADKDLDDTAKGKGKATARSLSAPRSCHSVLSAPAAGSGSHDGPGRQGGSEDEIKQPPPRRSARNGRGRQDEQTPQAAEGGSGPSKSQPNTQDATTPETRKWRHQSRRYWKIFGIIDENEDSYLTAWRPDRDGNPYANSWQKKYFVNAKATRDWERRKDDEDLRAVFDSKSTDEDEDE